MTTLNTTEQQKIKDWILFCADKEVILRMQNNTQKLGFMYEEELARNGDVQSYEYVDAGQTVSFEDKAIQHKYYAAIFGINSQGFMQMLSRGGHQKEHLKVFHAQCQRVWNQSSEGERAQMSLAMALVEAQTGFFNLGPQQFKALQTAPSNARNLPHPHDNYADMANTRPPELKRLTLEEFLQLRQSALEEGKLWLGKPSAAVTVPAPAPTSHAAKAPPPKADNAWVDETRVISPQGHQKM